MESEDIEILLEKYWLGETSLKEEKTLQEYFNQNASIPTHLKKAAALFKYFGEEGKITLGDSDNLVSLNKWTRKTKVRRLFPHSLSNIAAVILVLVISVFLIYQLKSPKGQVPPIAENNINTYEDPVLAFKETKRALLLVSGKLNAPEKYTEEMGKMGEAAALFK